MNTTDTIAANETLRQLGGASRLGVMVNAKGFYHADAGRRLHFSVTGGLHVDVTLEASDLYAVKVQKVRGSKVTLVRELDGVDVAGLIPALEGATGLRFRL